MKHGVINGKREMSLYGDSNYKSRFLWIRATLNFFNCERKIYSPCFIIVSLLASIYIWLIEAPDILSNVNKHRNIRWTLFKSFLVKIFLLLSIENWSEQRKPFLSNVNLKVKLWNNGCLFIAYILFIDDQWHSRTVT